MSKRIDELTAHPESAASPLTSSSVLPIRDPSLSSENTRKITLGHIRDHAVNILNFGADPTGASNSTAAIQAAIDSMNSGTYPNYPGTVFCPRGQYLINTLTLHQGVNIVGDGTGPIVGTSFIQVNGVNANAFQLSSALVAGLYSHGIGLMNFRLTKQTGSTDTVGTGIYINSNAGEGFLVDRLVIGGFPENGIHFTGAIPLFIRNIHTFVNDGYGLVLERANAKSWAASYCLGVSGDDNGSALIHCLHSTPVLIGVKAERTAVGRQLNAVEITGTGASEFVVIQGLSFSGSGTAGAGNACVLINGHQCSVYITGVCKNNGSVSPTYLIDDQYRSKQIPFDLHTTSTYYAGRVGTVGGELFRLSDVGCKMSIGVDPDAIGSTFGIGVTNGNGDGTVTAIQASAKGTQTNAPASMNVNKWVRAQLGSTSGWIPFFT